MLSTIASVDYFETMGIKILQGRGFTRTDVAEGTLVTVIDETMAEKFWPGEDAVGKRVTMKF